MRAVMQSFRTLRRSPWHSATVIGIVALGMALATTVFALVDGVLFKPLPYRAPGELYAAGVVAPGSGANGSTSPRELLAWRAAVSEASFTAVNGWVGLGTLGVVNGPLAWSVGIDAEFFGVLGVQPLVGRFAPGDYTPNRFFGPAIISYQLWQRLYGGSVDVIGERIPFDRYPLHVVGVLPHDFVFPAGQGGLRPDVLLPTALPSESASLAGRSLDVIARAPAGFGAGGLRERLSALVSEPGIVQVAPLDTVLVRDERPTALLTLAAVGVIVLLVALNVGGLCASRAMQRLREFAARRALGASVAHLATVQLIEAAGLVSLGSLLGALLARPMLTATVRLLPENVRLLREPIVDFRVASLVAVAAALVALVVAASGLRVARQASLTSLIGSGAGRAPGQQHTRGRFVFLAAQVAIAMMLVIGGTLFIASLREVWATEPGFAVEHTLYLDVRAGGAPSRERDVTRTLAITEALRAIPAVERAAAMDTIFLGGFRRGSPFTTPAGAAGGDPELIPISSDFFAVMNIVPVAGRLLTNQEIDSGARLAVVSERAAVTFWPGKQALGQTLESPRATVTVVGIVPDGRYQRFDRPSDGEIFVPLAAAVRPSAAPTFLLTSRAPEHAVLASAIEAVRRMDPSAQVRRAETVTAALAASVQRRRFHAWLFGVFSIAGLVLAAAGVLELVAASTRRRTHEIGIRMALGATSGRVMRQIVAEQLYGVAAGLGGGTLMSLWAVQALRSLLYEVQPFDLRLWGLAATVVVLVAILGALAPALAASRVQPVIALRAD